MSATASLPATPPCCPPANRHDIDSSPLTPDIRPHHPYTQHSATGRALIKRRESLLFPTDLDQWLQANMSLWPAADPRLPTTVLFPEQVSCTVEMLFIEVCFTAY